MTNLDWLCLWLAVVGIMIGDCARDRRLDALESKAAEQCKQ